MKLIFKVNGSDFLIENNPSVIPQIGWIFKVFGKIFKVDGVELDYDLPKEENILIIHLENDLSSKSKKKQVQVKKVWKQNENSLTIHKVYEVIAENKGYFSIMDDKGKLKKYQDDNLQFRHL